MSTRKPAHTKQTKKIAVNPIGKLSPAKKGQRDEERWRAFAREYVIDFNGTQAAIRAGYSEKSARSIAARLLTKDNIQKFVQEASARLVERAELDGVAVVRRLNDMLLADPRELVEVYVSCCRYCYGASHGYQYTLGEYNEKREKWLDDGKPIERFEEKGGVGYDGRKPPMPECPECFGQGVSRTVLKDTRHLSRRGLSLFAGVKAGAGGAMSVQLHSQLDVAEKLMRHHGMYEKDNKQQGAGGMGGTWNVTFVDAPKHVNDPLDKPGAPGGEK